jgi:predicted nucleic acid-binding protein
MSAVSDTSAISNLAIIDRLQLLQQQFGVVWIPPGVAEELDQLAHSAARSAIRAAREAGWLHVYSPNDRATVDALAAELDRGESEAIALAVERRPDFLIIDELDGRSHATRAGLPVVGILGILLQAKSNGQIVSVRHEMLELRQKARFFIAPELEQRILKKAGE